VEEYLGDGNNRHDKKWTKSIAVGSKSFVERVKTLLGAVTRGRKVREASEAYQRKYFSCKSSGFAPSRESSLTLHIVVSFCLDSQGEFLYNTSHKKQRLTTQRGKSS